MDEVKEYEYDEEDGIYVFEDDSDSQTLLDLQLELALVKKKLKVTEMAYRALEDEFVSIRAANNIVLVLVNDLAHLYKRFKSASTTTTSKAVVSEEHDAGLQAARRLIEGVRKNLVDQGDATDPQVVLLVVPDSTTSRDFVSGFGNQQDAFVFEQGRVDKLQDFVNLLLPMPQLRKVYLALNPEATSRVLLPHIMETISQMYGNGDQPTHRSSNPSSPTLPRRRSWTSTSSLSCLSRAASSSDAALAKFVLYQAEIQSKLSLSATRNAVLQSCADRQNILKEVLETDFEHLFARVDLPSQESVGEVKQEPSQGQVEKNTQPVQEGPRDGDGQEGVGQASKTSTNIPFNAGDASADTTRKGSGEPARQDSRPTESSSVALETTTHPVATNAAPPPATGPTPPSKWAEIVRKGKHPASSPEAVTSPLPQPSSSTARQEVSPSRTEAGDGIIVTGNANIKAAKPKAERPMQLDPNLSLCRQKIPPCNQYYLTKRGCTNPKCNYSHTYKLNDKQIEELRSGAARTACVYRKQKAPCMGGEDCVFGHKCPQGSRCKQGSRCHFPPHMH